MACRGGGGLARAVQHLPPRLHIVPVEGDGRCLYRSIQILSGTEWHIVQSDLIHALLTRTDLVGDRWPYDQTPADEAARLTWEVDARQVPEPHWPGEEALHLISLQYNKRVRVATQFGVLTYNDQAEDEWWVCLTGSHYQPAVPTGHEALVRQGEFVVQRDARGGSRKCTMVGTTSREKMSRRVTRKRVHGQHTDAAVCHPLPPPELRTDEPGGKFFTVKFATANIESIRRHEQAVWSLDAQVYALQEMRLGKAEVESWHKHFRSQGFQAFLNPHGAGVGVIVSDSLQAWASPTPCLERWALEGRVAEADVVIGGLVYHIVSMYNFSDYARCMSASEEFITSVCDMIAARAKMPVLVLGDQNVDLSASVAWQRAIAGGLVHDAVLLHEGQHEVEHDESHDDMPPTALVVCWTT